MESERNNSIKSLCELYESNNHIDTALYGAFNVKRGLRNSDGTGVMAGLTLISNVHGYVLDEGDKTPIEGELTYRGINIKDIINGCKSEHRFGFEEVIWLLIFGSLPNKSQLDTLGEILEEYRELPPYFTEDMIMKAPSPNIMNKLARGVLALYSYDDCAEDMSLENQIRQSLELIARLPNIMVSAFQVKRRYYDHTSMYFHQPIKGQSIAEDILSTMRNDRRFTDEEAKLLDMCLMVHAEHGGGNNSTFATRVLSSSGTDIYASISAAISALKGPKHGGANAKVMEMLDYFKENVSHWDNDAEVAEYLRRVIRCEGGDRSGLVYGMGHAIYTKSDPRAVILKENAEKLAYEKGFDGEFCLLDSIERQTPKIFSEMTGKEKTLCANVDLYSGLVYKMLGIPPELFTPVFAVSRIPGWCAHRLEEVFNGGRIIRPAYKSVSEKCNYTRLSER